MTQIDNPLPQIVHHTLVVPLALPHGHPARAPWNTARHFIFQEVERIPQTIA
jgi:hypothetical protein